MSPVYLYMIDVGEDTPIPDIAGVGGAGPLCLVTGEGLGCVVSDHTGWDITAIPREQLVRHLITHQQVIEHVMDDRSVLPVRFGTVLDSEFEVMDELTHGRSKLAEAFASVQDKVEIEVAATWDTRRVLKEVGADEEVVRAREAVAGSGGPTLEDRVRLGRVVKACLDRRRNGYRQRMLDILRPASVDTASNALIAEEMVMNEAFLVERDGLPGFNQAVERLDGLFGGEIDFRVIGPLPPYSFATVDIKRITGDEIRAARRSLHLDGQISEVEVRRAYRRLAAEGQRDPAAGTGPASARLAGLRRASDLLIRYCRANRESPARGPRHCPEGEGADGLFVVAVERSRSDDIDSARFGAVAPASLGRL